MSDKPTFEEWKAVQSQLWTLTIDTDDKVVTLAFQGAGRVEWVRVYDEGDLPLRRPDGFPFIPGQKVTVTGNSKVAVAWDSETGDWFIHEQSSGS